MSVALRGIAIPHLVVVHAVDGLEPGVYRWPDLSASVHPGAMREELFRVCLDQGLARDAAFVVIGATDVGTLDDRAYRESPARGRHGRGRLHLAAYGLGASATGMTFLDSEMPALLGTPTRRVVVHVALACPKAMIDGRRPSGVADRLCG